MFRKLITRFFFFITQAVRFVVATIFFWSAPVLRATSFHLSRFDLRYFELIGGLKVVMRGEENISDSTVIYAAKHQTQLEIMILVAQLKKSNFVIKESLAKIPIIGWAALTIGTIAIDREKGAQSLRKMVRQAKARIADGYSIIIFPEGTRRLVGAPPAYKSGVYELYRALKVPVVPVALNSGVRADRTSWFVEPGSVTVSYLPAIEPGLDRETFMATLIEMIETETDRLVAEELGHQSPEVLQESEQVT